MNLYAFFRTALGRLRMVGFLEGMSYLMLLAIAMPLKYLAGQPEAVRFVGMVHGVLFIAYVLQLLLVKLELDWSMKKVGLAFLASLVPFGFWYAETRIFRPAAAAPLPVSI